MYALSWGTLVVVYLILMEDHGEEKRNAWLGLLRFPN